MNHPVYGIISLAVGTIMMCSLLIGIYRPGLQRVGQSSYENTNTTLVGSHIHEQPSNNP